MAKLLPTSIRAPHLQVFDDLMAGRLDALPLGDLLVYLVDTVKADALPYLAEQFDILGIKGYAYATTEAQRRDVIRNAIELHRYKGTPWAIKEALSKIGIIVNRIEEGVGSRTFYDATYNRNGSRTRGSGGHWAYFRVYINTSTNSIISATQIAEAVAIINEYKNVRSWLYDITIEVESIDDPVEITDTVFADAGVLPTDDFGTYYNGLYLRNGTRLRANISDEVTTLEEEIDPDAGALIAAITAAGGSTTQTEQDAVNFAITELKAQSLWNKFYALWFFIGGTATSHKFNAKNPADTDGAYRLSFFGGGTHSATGYLPNGVNGYALTHFVPATHGIADNMHIAYHSRTTSTGAYVEMGCNGSGGSAGIGQTYISPSLSGSAFRAVNLNGNSSGAALNSKGFFVASRTSNINQKLYRDGAVVGNDATSAVLNERSTRIVTLAARNNNGTPDLFTNRECIFASIGEGLTDAEVTTFNTIIQAFQTMLGNRQI